MNAIGSDRPSVEAFENENALWLPVSFAIAVVAQAIVIYSLAHRSAPVPMVTATAGPPPIEAQIFEKPPEQSHLVERKSVVAPHPAAPEKVLSKTVGVGKSEPKSAAPAEPESNKAEPARPEIVTHGPIVVSSPPPVLPEHLRDQNLKTSVLIEFTIGADGHASPQLLGSSGNDELDALALRAAQSWTFSPAVQSNAPVASKVRLRINFQVD